MDRIPGLFISESKLSGRGVFCANDIIQGSLIEICPVIIIPIHQMDFLKKTALYDYYFEWGEKNQEGAIALGLGSIYNHSTNSNARYLLDFEKKTIDIYSISSINAGEEITVNYNGDPNEKGKVWFQ